MPWWNRTTMNMSIAVFQSFSCLRLFATPWTAAHQASPSITNCWSLLKLMSIESVIPAYHLIFCPPFLLLPSIFPSIRVFSSESIHIRCSKYWDFSFSISLSNEYSGLISFRIDLIWQSKGFSRVFSNTSSKASFLSVQPSLWSNSHIRTWLLEKCMRPCYFGSPTVPCNMDLCVWL